MPGITTIEPRLPILLHQPPLERYKLQPLKHYLQLGNEHWSVLLPLLVVLVVSVFLIVLLLTHGHTRDLRIISRWVGHFG